MKPPAFAVQALREWGRQVRRIRSGAVTFPDGHRHEDGWPTSSIAARLIDGGITGGSNTAVQHYEEVYRGDALDVWRIVRKAPTGFYEILVTHHAGLEEADMKARKMGMSRARYFDAVRLAQWWVAAKLEELQDPS